MSLELFTDEDYFSRMFRKSESKRTEHSARVSLKIFDIFCKHQGTTINEMIEMYQKLSKESDIRSICLSLDKFVNFLDQDHEGISKRKSPKTIKTYFGFVKSYLRICHGVKVSIDDVKDYIQFPKPRKVPRKAIPIKVLKLICNNASPQRRALYYTLISSGMRLGEALSLTKKNFHTNENPVRITIDAENTKTKESRETFITSEAFEKVQPILESKGDDEFVFTEYKDNIQAVINEDQVFGDLRVRLGLTERYIEQYFDAKHINLEELAVKYGLKEQRTILLPCKQPDFNEVSN
ncbi:tyrosine-type recombinase/integrase [Nitrosopumilus ureiphilus]|nr:tyrosine-type recombinase/integrase [Nitrosopumilus ureiphilus]